MATEEAKIENLIEKSHRSRKRIKEVKRKARPGLKNKPVHLNNATHVFFLLFLLELSSTHNSWSELNYAEKFEQFTQFEDNVERIHASDVDCQEFIDKYEKHYKPVGNIYPIEFNCYLIIQIKESFVFSHNGITGRLESSNEMDVGPIIKEISQPKVQMRRR